MIEIKNVSTSYAKGIKVIDNMNLTIDSGVVFGFIGPNGARKNYYNRDDNRSSRNRRGRYIN